MISVPLIVANWKMNTIKRGGDLALAKEYVTAFGSVKKGTHDRDIVICPTFLGISDINQFLTRKKNSGISMSAQDCAWEEKGAFTGEVSPKSLELLGVKYVLIGHSERRNYLGETNEIINKKLLGICSATKALTPILCIGENLEERNSGKTEAVLELQLKSALAGVVISAKRGLVVAYEPVWAIGTGEIITPELCRQAYQTIASLVAEYQPGLKLGTSLRILYGGSVTSEEVASLVDSGVSDGVLVGGASLKIREFKKLTEQVYRKS